jgi:hypothetical protein
MLQTSLHPASVTAVRSNSVSVVSVNTERKREKFLTDASAALIPQKYGYRKKKLRKQRVQPFPLPLFKLYDLEDF